MSSAIKEAYSGSGTSLTFGANVASLASSATLVAGVETSEVDNTTNLYDDYLVRGHVKAGTSPTVGTTIEVWVIPIIDGDAYPDVFDGTASTETVTSRNVLRSVGKLGATITVDNTTGNVYGFHFTLSSIPGIGQSMPRKFVLFLVHNTGAALDSTAGNHGCDVVGVYYNVG